jgi:multisubunit Na+/H+ antiporter MnhG subunit
MSTNESRHADRSIERTDPFEAHWDWNGGALAGLLATVAMGVAISLTDLSTLQIAIAGLYGQSGSLVAGWIAHLVHGIVFGSLFTLLLADPGLHRLTDWYWKTILAGVVYSVLLAVAGAGILMPIWLGQVGMPVPRTIPNVTTPMLVWHLIYGLVLGGLYPAIDRR